MDRLTAFVIGYALMFTAHYWLEPTWQVNEPRSTSLRLIFNYVIGTLGIALPFLFLHPDLWLDLAICIAGAGSATVLAHSRDGLFKLINRDRAHGLIEERKDQA